MNWTMALVSETCHKLPVQRMCRTSSTQGLGNMISKEESVSHLEHRIYPSKLRCPQSVAAVLLLTNVKRKYADWCFCSFTTYLQDKMWIVSFGQYFTISGRVCYDVGLKFWLWYARHLFWVLCSMCSLYIPILSHGRSKLPRKFVVVDGNHGIW